jgi:hypothetical protein
MAGDSLKSTAAAIPSAWYSCFSVGANSWQKGQLEPKNNSSVVLVADPAETHAKPARKRKDTMGLKLQVLQLYIG